MVTEYILTTRDNPFDFFTQFDEWFAYDCRCGYNCCGIVAQIANTSPDLSQEVNTMITNQAIDEFLLNDPFGIYKKVSRDQAPDN